MVKNSVMTSEEKHKQKAKIIAGVKKWPARIKKLKLYKSVRQFCISENIDPSQFNRWLHLKGAPNQQSFEKVECAFLKHKC